MWTDNKDGNIEKDKMTDNMEENKNMDTSQQETWNTEANQGKAEDIIDCEALLQEKNELHDKYMRLAAEYSNYKRRTDNEKKDIYSYANEKIISELLNVLDNFERAIDSMPSGNMESISDGVNMIFKQFMGVLESNGLSEINSEQCQFDPNFHHAVLTECAEGIESNTIIQVLQKGYALNGKVVRPSMVKVAE
ncbi:MAG: nucleotide exchange factor GrpE [Peptostreptococcales bacterium]